MQVYAGRTDRLLHSEADTFPNLRSSLNVERPKLLCFFLPAKPRAETMTMPTVMFFNTDSSADSRTRPKLQYGRH